MGFACVQDCPVHQCRPVCIALNEVEFVIVAHVGEHMGHLYVREEAHGMWWQIYRFR